ncbi:MAG: hypothetical protein GY847_28035 [Proteobacteria bacterium]|nr:hypothetical protein [Pseudomonadota bacterium]
MAHYRNPEHKASETVTFRLTVKERRLLDHIAEVEQKSLTDLIRSLLIRQAKQMGVEIDEVPVKPRRKRPGRPKTKRERVSIPAPYLPEDRRTPDQAEIHRIEMTFGDLVEQFREHFSGRAEGTRKELEETLLFFSDRSGDGVPLLPLDMPLSELTSLKLKEVRDAMITLDIRVAKKNLHLTYLRMMLHWAVKQTSIELNMNPALDLKPFTISELPQSWIR